MPQWYLDRPADPPEWQYFFGAFSILCTERALGQAIVGPIPWSRAMAYASRQGMSRDVADAFWQVIHAMDNAERQWWLDEAKAESCG